MATYHRTEGICLRRLDYSNTSQIATFLTRARGRLSFLAKGIRRAPKHGISSGFELLGRYELIFTERRSSSLNNLTQNFLIEPFAGMRAAVERVLCAYYAAELALSLTAEDEPCEGLYELITASLRRFERGEDLGLSVLYLEIGALREHGACPTFGACAMCSRRLPAKGRLLFSPEEGGTLCPACAQKLPPRIRPHGVPVHGRRLALLDALSRRPFEALAGLDARPAEIVAASRVLRFHMSHLVGKELTMWKYMQERHLSRTLRRFRRRAGVA